MLNVLSVLGVFAAIFPVRRGQPVSAWRRRAGRDCHKLRRVGVQTRALAVRRDLQATPR